jgi:hypothetical protein
MEVMLPARSSRAGSLRDWMRFSGCWLLADHRQENEGAGGKYEQWGHPQDH